MIIGNLGSASMRWFCWFRAVVVKHQTEMQYGAVCWRIGVYSGVMTTLLLGCFGGGVLQAVTNLHFVFDWLPNPTCSRNEGVIEVVVLFKEFCSVTHKVVSHYESTTTIRVMMLAVGASCV